MGKRAVLKIVDNFCSPYGIRTRVTRMKTWRPDLARRTDRYLLNVRAKVDIF